MDCSDSETDLFQSLQSSAGAEVSDDDDDDDDDDEFGSQLDAAVTKKNKRLKRYDVVEVKSNEELQQSECRESRCASSEKSSQGKSDNQRSKASSTLISLSDSEDDVVYEPKATARKGRGRKRVAKTSAAKSKVEDQDSDILRASLQAIRPSAIVKEDFSIDDTLPEPTEPVKLQLILNGEKKKAYKLLKNQKFVKLIAGFAKQNQHLDQETIKMSFKGRAIDPLATPGDLGMENDAVVEVTAVATGPAIHLKLCWSNGKQSKKYQVLMHEPFRNLKTKYCTEYGIDEASVKLVLDGAELDLDQTAQHEDLMDDDQIDVVRT